MKQENDKQEIENRELDPKIPNGTTKKQKQEQNYHPGVCHQESPPLEHPPGASGVTRLEPFWQFARVELVENFAQLLQLRCEHFLLPGEIKIKREQEFIPWLATPFEFAIPRSQERG